jgi:NADPH:quinone reductase-like Zn-dependent oxidoreductase
MLFGVIPPAPWLTNDQLVQRLGAEAVIDYRKSEDEQLQDLKTITGGNFFGVFDTVAKFTDWSLKALREVSTTEKKHFATTNDWYVNDPCDVLTSSISKFCYSLRKHRTPGDADGNITVYQISLGLIGKSGDALAGHPNLNDDIAAHIAIIHQLLEDNKLQPNEVNVVEKGGFEGVADAIALQQKGQSGGKIVITLQEE